MVLQTEGIYKGPKSFIVKYVTKYFFAKKPSEFCRTPAER